MAPIGTTSACAENTGCGKPQPTSHRNYLRVRGEYCLPPYLRNFCRELPPRARRIPGWAIGLDKLPGTTSACAENTFIELAIAGYIRNYLRVRGEYFTAFTQSGSCRELPPRARRIHCVRESIRVKTGTTSACAENTRTRRLGSCATGNYLRVRGEYMACCPKRSRRWELPPRARRIRNDWCCHGSCGGTTSACAENTRNA